MDSGAAAALDTNPIPRVVLNGIGSRIAKNIDPNSGVTAVSYENAIPSIFWSGRSHRMPTRN